MDWDRDLENILKNGMPAVLATVIYVQGSAPRNPGAKMLITHDALFGTIGGGNFEYIIAEQGRKILQNGDKHVLVQHYPLGPLTRQCCGGRVSILLEKFTPEMLDMVSEISNKKSNSSKHSLVSIINENKVSKSTQDKNVDSPALYYGTTLIDDDVPEPWDTKDTLLFVEPLRKKRTPLFIFGAGHVGRALVPLLSNLFFDVKWIDMRASEFPDDIPLCVEKCISDQPLAFVNAAPPGSFFLIFTHSHALDFEITAQILERGDAHYCGLIASKTKRARFKSRFTKEKNISDVKQDKLTSPIGLSDIKGKEPSVIALSVCAQLLMEWEKRL